MRVDEGRKGLSKSDGAVFKRAVRLVKDRRDQAACADWAALGRTNPDHAPTIYNVGLCAETAGEDAIAQQQYRRVLLLNPKHSMAQAGLGRIADRSRSRRQIAAHDAD